MAEPDEAQAEEHERIEPVEPEPDLSEVEGFPTALHPTFVHRPETIYWYDGDAPTMHPVLGRLEPGPNQWESDDPRLVEAIQACVTSGLLQPEG